MTNEEKINLIGQKIMLLSNNMDKYQQELLSLKQQLDQLRTERPLQQNTTTVEFKQENIKTEVVSAQSKLTDAIKEPASQQDIPSIKVNPQQPFNTATPKESKAAFNFEEFIGGKLITIIGIAILVIGMGIGVKYAIDNNMLGPLARIILAYIAGGTLLFLALRLKTNYKSFSAVLLSGGMASLYFTTFIAYTLYGMFGQIAAFGIMVLFTMFTVFAATVYNLQIIGIIGLVGAYIVPMLLSDGSGKIEVMFSYMLIVNVGILVLSFKKYWQILNHVAFAFTWLTIFVWFVSKFDHEIHTSTALIFSFLFFIIFYISNMSYKIMKQEKFQLLDIIRIVSNSFIFFGIGYATLNHSSTKDYLGVFTVANALIHFTFSYIVFQNKLLDRKLFYLLIALVLSFITIAVPVQLDGNWVTLFWASEAVLLFTIGRYKAVRFYEWLGYTMIFFAILSLIQDGSITYNSLEYNNYMYKFWKPFANIHLFTSLFVISALGAMVFVHQKKELTAEEYKLYPIYQYMQYILPSVLLIITYFTFSNEISFYYQSQFEKSLISIPSNEPWAITGELMEMRDHRILQLKNVMLGIYNFVFMITFSLLAIYKVRSNVARISAVSLNTLLALGFISAGLSNLSQLEHFNREVSHYYVTQNAQGYLRYLSFALFAVLLFMVHKIISTDFFKRFTIHNWFVGCIIHLFILVILSNELVHLQSLKNDAGQYYASNAVYKLGYTSLWGIYSFLLIAYGIFKKNKIMRISAISLFGITLLKLVTYDTWDLSAGYKVIAYMLLGAILLVVAFLYQKFKVIIFGDDKN